MITPTVSERSPQLAAVTHDPFIDDLGELDRRSRAHTNAGTRCPVCGRARTTH
jgi:hypothetical protein